MSLLEITKNAGPLLALLTIVSREIMSSNKFYALTPTTPNLIMDNNVANLIIKMYMLNKKLCNSYSGHGGA
jgi:hypothetical protein